MERLLADAEKLSGQKFDISSYADIVEAIHVVQTEMGITGTTAAEAASTIQGSLGAMKSAWANLVTGLGNENANLEGLIDNFVGSLETAAGNIGPRLVQILSGLGQAITQLAPVLAGQVSGLVGQLLPPMLDAGAQLLVALVTGLVSALPELAAAVPGVLQAFWGALEGSMPQLLEAGGRLMEMLKTGLVDGIPRLLEALPDVLAGLGSGFYNGLGNAIAWGADLISSLADGILGALPQLISRLPEVFSQIFSAFSDGSATVWQAGATLLLSLLDGIVNTIPQLTAALPEVISTIADTLTEGLPELADTGMEILTALLEGILDTLPELASSVPQLISTIVETLSENLPQIVQTGMGILLSLIDGVIDNLPNLIGAAIEIIGRLVDSLFDNFPKIVNAGLQLLEQLLVGIIGAIPEIAKRIPEVLDALVLGFLDGVERLKDAGAQLLTGLWEGISDKVQWLKDKVSGVVDRIKDWFTGKSGFDEHSPSRWAYEVGALVPEGLANGVDDRAGKVQQSAEKIAKNTYSTLKTWADRQTKYLSLSFDEQIELWEEIQKQFRQGSQQFLEAEEKLFDLRQKRDQEYARQQKQRQQEYEKALKEREAALKEYQGKVEQIQKEMASAEQEYQQAQESRTQQIFNSFGLFDELPQKQKVTGDQLLKNLSSQVTAMDQFYAGLEKLAGRGVGTDLVEEIRQMGPKAKAQLDALLAMSDSKLDQYARLYGEKQQLASQTAAAELADFQRETEEKIAQGNRQLERLNREYAPKIGYALTDGLSASVGKGMGKVQAAAVQAVETAYRAAMAKLDQLNQFWGGSGYQKSILPTKSQLQSMNYGNVGFGESAYGLSTAALMNSLAGAGGGQDINLTVQVNIDGKQAASALFAPLVQFARANGTPIVNGV